MTVTYFKIKKGKVITLEDLQRRFIEVGVPVTLMIASMGHQEVLAAGTNVKQKLKPVIDILQDLAEPVAYGYMILGAIKYISGHSNEGGKMIKNAVGGFILVQWIPWLFEIVRGIGKQ